MSVLPDTFFWHHCVNVALQAKRWNETAFPCDVRLDGKTIDCEFANNCWCFRKSGEKTTDRKKYKYKILVYIVSDKLASWTGENSYLMVGGFHVLLLLKSGDYIPK